VLAASAVARSAGERAGAADGSSGSAGSGGTFMDAREGKGVVSV
jgi:hypothetical protein